MSSEEQQQDQYQSEEGSTSAARRRQRGQPMPSEDMMRNSIASNLTHILVNMRNANYRQKCREILQVDDLSQGAHIKILQLLEHIDEKRTRPRTRKM